MQEQQHLMHQPQLPPSEWQYQIEYYLGQKQSKWQVENEVASILITCENGILASSAEILGANLGLRITLKQYRKYIKGQHESWY